MIPHAPFFFDGWYNIGRAITLSVIGFLSLIALLRVSGKRTLSKLNVFDFVFVVAVGSVFAASIMEKDVTLVEGIAALATLVGMQIGLAELAARSELAERIINGEPALLLSHGRFIPRALKRERITEEEVRAAIRAKGVTRVEDVDAVVLENDGTLTVAWTSKEPEGEKTALVDAAPAAGDKPEERRTAANR
ncbi:MAG TPA: YetF domain-containing protein [Gemmatimonadaceae bacterium]|nr:YetF domain-containing protein [Gemmatimonadaceae bacterium]